MPPLRGIDRGLNGEALKALEESGHGRRLAIVDASYNIPRWAQVVEYHGHSSAQALLGIGRLLPIELGSIRVMIADREEESHRAELEFAESCNHLTDELKQNLGYEGIYRLDDQESDFRGESPIKSLGFYSLANNEVEDTLYVRTRDTLPYACATFIIGHMQVAG